MRVLSCTNLELHSQSASRAVCWWECSLGLGEFDKVKEKQGYDRRPTIDDRIDRMSRREPPWWQSALRSASTVLCCGGELEGEVA